MDIYVANLPITMNSEDLEKLFKQYGTVRDINFLKNKLTGLPSGIAFVKMMKRSEALSAINTLNGVELDGKTVYVKEAYKPRSPTKKVSSQND